MEDPLAMPLLPEHPIPGPERVVMPTWRGIRRLAPWLREALGEGAAGRG